MNFILVQYEHQYTYIESLMNYHRNSKTYHLYMIRQLQELYPNSTIHVIVDKKPDQPEKGVLYHPIHNLDKNNYAKLHIFGLLTKPAMYIDNDILLLRPFEEQHLPMESPFNVYQKYKQANLKSLPDWVKGYPHYNTGMIWIPKPDIAIVSELLGLRDKFKIHKNGWVNDEYPVSYFIQEHNLEMKIIDEVSAYRDEMEFGNVAKQQSVHYTGPTVKDLLLPEYFMLKKKIYL